MRRLDSVNSIETKTLSKLFFPLFGYCDVPNAEFLKCEFSAILFKVRIFFVRHFLRKVVKFFFSITSLNIRSFFSMFVVFIFLRQFIRIGT